MFSHTTVPYRNASKIANHVMMLILRSEDEKGAAMLCREWVALEYAKREWRGVPKLSSHSIKELLEAKLSRSKQLNSSNVTVTELDDDKESIGQTVPAPPTPETPSASSVVNDK